MVKQLNLATIDSMQSLHHRGRSFRADGPSLFQVGATGRLLNLLSLASRDRKQGF